MVMAVPVIVRVPVGMVVGVPRGVRLGGRVDLPADGQLGHGRHRHRDVAVGGPHPTGTQPHRGRRHRLHPQRHQGRARPDHVGDRVQRTHLVEVHGIRLDPVDATLGVRQPAEGRQGPGPHPVVQTGLLQRRPDRRPVPVRRVLHQHPDTRLRGPLATADDRLGLERHRARRHRVDGPLHGAGVGPGVEQGPEEHVAGDPGGDVEPRVHACHCVRRPRTRVAM